jgi:hypothetical protein
VAKRRGNGRIPYCVTYQTRTASTFTKCRRNIMANCMAGVMEVDLNFFHFDRNFDCRRSSLNSALSDLAALILRHIYNFRTSKKPACSRPHFHIISTAYVLLHFSSRAFSFLSSFSSFLPSRHVTILQPRPAFTLWCLERISAKPPILPQHIHSSPSIRPRDTQPGKLWIWRTGRGTGVWSGIWGRVWSRTRSEWEDGRAGRIEDGLVSGVWDGGV